MAKYKLKNLLKEFHAGKSIASDLIRDVGEYPVFGGNGQRGYTDTYNQGGQYLIIGRQGAYCGNVRYNIGKAFLTEHAIVGQANEENNAIYLALKLSLMDLGKLQGQSAQPGLSVETLSCISLDIPSKEIQDAIANIIVTIDQKISLNRQINDNLEAMAKQLYDYWFVQFDFPNEEGKPYKSSGGEMVYNERLKRDIPRNWNDCLLGDYIGRITNGLNPRKNFVLGSGNNYYVTIRSLAGTTIDWNNCDRCDDDALKKINSRSQLQIGDVVFSAIGTIGRTYYILEEPNNWNISETSFTLRPKEDVPNDFFYGMLRSDEIQIKADKAAMGSTLRCLVMDSLCSILYVKIPKTLIQKFSCKVSAIYRQIHRNNQEIAELTKQRDELLPLLMNGQTSINYHLSDD